MRWIRGAIWRGELRPGDRLPLREELIRRFGTTSMTMQRAFNRLSADGFVVVPRDRSGTFVSERPPNLFRIGVVFPDDRQRTLRNRHWRALVAALSEYDGRATEKRLVPYFGIGPDNDGRGRDLLLEDIDRGRLAGLILAWMLPLSPSLRDRFLPYRIPAVHLSSSVSDYHTVSLVDFPVRAMEEMARLGVKRVALLLGIHLHSLIGQYRELAGRFGMTLSPSWCFGLSTSYPEWAREALEMLVSLPSGEGPDGLLVSDDHFEESVALALRELGAGDRFKVVCHGNFPAAAKSMMAAVRVGFDSRREIALSLSVLGRLTACERGGIGAEIQVVTLPPCTEDEAAASLGRVPSVVEMKK